MLFTFLHTRDRGPLDLPCVCARAPKWLEPSDWIITVVIIAIIRGLLKLCILFLVFHRLIHKTFDSLFRFAQPSCWHVIASISRINQNVYPGSNQCLWDNFRRNYFFVLATKEVNILFIRQLLWQNNKVDNRPRNIYIISCVLFSLFYKRDKEELLKRLHKTSSRPQAAKTIV